MKKLLLSAFACDPTRGSEPSYGWNWALGLAERGYEVHCFTRQVGRSGIESRAKPDNLFFHYIELPLKLEKLYSASTATMYIYYILWQQRAYKIARKMHGVSPFDVAHHVTWGSLQLGSFLYKLDIPFIYGPAGGGQKAPESFKEYFEQYWGKEKQRETISKWMLQFNPACKKTLQKARVVLVSNNETLAMARKIKGSNVKLSLDVALPTSFSPEEELLKSPEPNRLRLLWTGRFMPRKGVLLLLDVMKELKAYSGITLTVVGDGQMKESFLKRVEDYQLGQSVDWKGWVSYSEIRNYYATHDIFFYTSLRDSGSLQLLEAMSFGMPVVTIDLHGQALIIDEDRGIKCACDTPEIAIKNLKEAIIKLYNTPALVTEKSKGAYAFARQNTWNKKISEIVKNYYLEV